MSLEGTMLFLGLLACTVAVLQLTCWVRRQCTETRALVNTLYLMRLREGEDE